MIVTVIPKMKTNKIKPSLKRPLNKVKRTSKMMSNFRIKWWKGIKRVRTSSEESQRRKSEVKDSTKTTTKASIKEHKKC